MKTVRDKEFKMRRDDSPTTFSGYSIRNCLFDNCSFSTGTRSPQRRSMFVDSELLNCRILNCQCGPGILDNVLIDDLRGNDVMILWGPLFRHVTLRGKITSVKVNRVFPLHLTKEQKRAFEKAAAQFYAKTDWALDIKEAQLSTFDISGVPTELIRYDPKYAMVVSRARALRKAWRKKASSWNRWVDWIDIYVDHGDPSFLLVAPYNKKVLRDGLSELRDLGLESTDPVT